MANDLQTQYTIGYYAEPSRKSWRRVEVKVNRHGLKVRARHGFSTVDAASALFSAGCTISPEQYPYPYERKLVHKDGRVIYHEDFTDIASGWPETGAHSNGTDADNPNLGYKNEGYVHRGYVKDGYELLRQAHDDSIALATIAAYGPWWTDFRATLMLRPNLGPSTQLASPAAAGLVFRMNERGYYAFLIAPAGNSRDLYYKLVRREFRDMQPRDLVDWTRASSLDVSPAANGWRQIAVECSGDKFTLFADGHQVLAIHDSRMQDGLVGMALYGTGRAIFRDLLVETLGTNLQDRPAGANRARGSDVISRVRKEPRP